jgi:hypothetical protein
MTRLQSGQETFGQILVPLRLGSIDGVRRPSTIRRHEENKKMVLPLRLSPGLFSRGCDFALNLLSAPARRPSWLGDRKTIITTKTQSHEENKKWFFLSVFVAWW